MNLIMRSQDSGGDVCYVMNQTESTEGAELDF